MDHTILLVAEVRYIIYRSVDVTPYEHIEVEATMRPMFALEPSSRSFERCRIVGELKDYPFRLSYRELLWVVDIAKVSRF